MAAGEQIRKFRRMHHLSQKALAEKIGDAIKLVDYFKKNYLEEENE